MIQSIEKFNAAVRQRGFVGACYLTLDWLLGLFGVRMLDAFTRRRISLSRELDRQLNSTVAYGPFKGLKLSAGAWWGAADRGAMLLGMYEQELLDALQTLPPNYDTFVDIGAADGYYGIGMTRCRGMKASWCFEMSAAGQELIRKNAELNGVAGSVEIRGAADANFLTALQGLECENVVLFVDIEGGEFELLDDSAFQKFCRSIIFVELHDWFYEDGNERLNRLKATATRTHTITEICTGGRNPSRYSELAKLGDTDRWLICSEGRRRLMTWWRLDPL